MQLGYNAIQQDLVLSVTSGVISNSKHRERHHISGNNDSVLITTWVSVLKIRSNTEKVILH